jgi:hypothetical protein
MAIKLNRDKKPSGDDGPLTAECDCGEKTTYYHLVEAAGLVGLYPESLRRAYRYSHGQFGTKIMGLFFTDHDLEKLGYPVQQQKGVVNV